VVKYAGQADQTREPYDKDGLPGDDVSIKDTVHADETWVANTNSVDLAM